MNIYETDNYESSRLDPLDNIIVYSFSEDIQNYQPSGHMNFEPITSFEINVEFKNKPPTETYTFDLHCYFMTYRKFTFGDNTILIE